ncbi:threonine ammonia-lyase [Snuella sedimenti]|uniref:L-threonine dehydratase n=1 Tax=Snuella sedimenti TaxID=2798802 RepID=A0A8J7JDH1_9FLAO|nr:threonine ammonia-lyase [Snuella sedimenti]MBJ6369049.1 threonine ammonia-lyase [Snuella sedimenti]
MEEEKLVYFPKIKDVQVAADTIKNVSAVTPLQTSIRYSNEHQANILLKREDLQQVRSYKIRGAYNKISSLTTEELKNGVVCASAGNHAQGFAFACNHLKIHGVVYMPSVTPMQKVEQTKMFGGDYITVVLEGDTFDDAYHLAMKACEKQHKTFIHPFDDKKVIEGQATIGLEILDQVEEPIDYVFVAVGGGGMAAGLSTVFNALSPDTKIIGVEPEGAPSMLTSIRNNKNTELDHIDKFIDGAAVKRVGDLTFPICKAFLHDVIAVPEGKVCQTILDLYNKDAIVVEPAGALSISALDFYAEKIKGKNVVCVVSGSNNDITRTPEIKERALLYANLKHYFIIKFPQRAGALREFVVDILGPNDDITYFQYAKKTNRENGAAVVGIQLKASKDLEPLITKMKAHNFYGDYLNDKPDLFQFLV